MRVVILGAGDVGRRLADRLSDRHQVLLLDVREECLGHPLEVEEVGGIVDHAGISCVHGDGTSRLALQKLRDKGLSCSLICTTPNDEVNLEAGRLGRDLGYDPVIAIANDTSRIEELRESHISVTDRSLLMAEELDRIFRHKGAIVPAGIGLGKGELVEIRLQAKAPVLNRPLKHLAPHRWRVAAVFRGTEVIVPTGETRLAEGDRVLLVGDPKILPAVAEYLRLGTPQFPRPYGPNVVTIEPDGPDEEICREAEALACGSGAAFLVRGLPGAEDDLPPQEDGPVLTKPACKGEVGRRTFALANEVFDLAQGVRRQHAGVVVMRPQSRSQFGRMLGLRGRDAEICDHVWAPVLFGRGRFPFRKILLPVSESDVNIHAAEMAIDISRQLGGTLTAMKVDLPQYISGLSDERLHEEVVPIRRLCQLYEVPLEYLHRHGNPVHELVKEADKHDLVVVARHRRRRDSYFDPDIALRIAREASCSVIVLTVVPQD